MKSEQVNRTGAGARLIGQLLPLSFLLGLVGLIAYAYAPSLRHGPRCDHWCYLLDTLEYDDFASIVAHSWSYSRTRTMGPGDTALFRPLLFVLMAAEKAVFANHFRAWQATGIVLHWVACALLFSFFRRLRSLSVSSDTHHSSVDFLPYVLTLFFAVNFAIAEQVVWSHITGYLAFTVLVLAAIRLLLELAAETDLSELRSALLLTSVWVLLFAATFTYELGQFAALCVALYLGATYVRKKRPKKAVVLLVLFAAIVGLYQSANHFDRWYHRHTYTDDLALTDLLDGLSFTTENLGRYLCYALVQPFLPMHCPCVLEPGRMILEEQLWQGKVSWDATAVSGLLVVGIAAVLAAYGLSRIIKSADLFLVMLLALGITASHFGLIVFGRLNLRPESLRCNSYYTYISLSFAMIGISVPLIALERLRPAGHLCRIAVGGLVAGLLGLTVLNLDATRRINVQGVSNFQALRAMNSALHVFVQQHGSEPGFRLAIVRGPSDGEPFLSTVLIFYHRYLDSTRPTYLVGLKNGRPVFTSMAQWRLEHPGEEPDCYPDVICPQPEYFVFRAADYYYAVPHRKFHQFLEVGERSAFTLCRPSLPELLALLAANRF